MKTKLLFTALLLGVAGITATAQQTISFETSEGYIEGSLFGQNDWDGSDGEEAHFYVSPEFASQGANSLQFLALDTQPDFPVMAVKEVSPTGNVFSISQDVYTDVIDDNNGSDFILVADNIVGTQNPMSTPASILYFDYEGNIFAVTDYDFGQEVFEEELVGQFEAGTWYTITATYDLTAGTVTYFIDGDEVYSGDLLKPVTEIKQIGYWFDDYQTSYYLDNINISTGTAGVKQNSVAGFSVAPNPAVNQVIISSPENALVNTITVTDINGRTVKSLTVNGLAETTVNVSDLASGVYMFRIASATGVTTKKVIKQ